MLGATLFGVDLWLVVLATVLTVWLSNIDGDVTSGQPPPATVQSYLLAALAITLAIIGVQLVFADNLRDENARRAKAATAAQPTTDDLGRDLVDYYDGDSVWDDESPENVEKRITSLNLQRRAEQRALKRERLERQQSGGSGGVGGVLGAVGFAALNKTAARDPEARRRAWVDQVLAVAKAQRRTSLEQLALESGRSPLDCITALSELESDGRIRGFLSTHSCGLCYVHYSEMEIKAMASEVNDRLQGARLSMQLLDEARMRLSSNQRI